jgi:hypothetical protein
MLSTELASLEKLGQRMVWPSSTWTTLGDASSLISWNDVFTKSSSSSMSSSSPPSPCASLWPVYWLSLGQIEWMNLTHTLEYALCCTSPTHCTPSGQSSDTKRYACDCYSWNSREQRVDPRWRLGGVKPSMDCGDNHNRRPWLLHSQDVVEEGMNYESSGEDCKFDNRCKR